MSRATPARLAVTLAVVLSLLATPAVGADPAGLATTGGGGSAAAGGELHRTLTVSLTPSEPGSVEVHARFEVPDGMTSLTAMVPAEATVTSTEGFSRRSETEYEWERTTDNPTLTWTFPVNRTTERRRGATVAGDEGYTFADVGEWALIPTPQLPVRYAGFGERPTVTQSVVIDGQGVAGSAISYLGPYREYGRNASGQRLRLVVPRAATMTEQPATVLDSVGDAASLDVGGRDEEVVMFAAPTSVRWGPPGLQRGPDEFWVAADQRVDRAGNIWLHEYVHTRQTAQTTDSGRWLVEGSAEYLAGLLAYEQGRVDFERFRGHLAFGTRERYASAVLANPDSWRDSGANYWKGALVAGAVDRQIRLATDRERTLADVYRRLNGQENVSNDEFLAAVEAVAGRETRRYAARYTTTEAVPDLWNRSQHAAAFGSTANVRTGFESLRVEGPYRNATVSAPATVAPDERVTAAVRVENVGTSTGTFGVPFVVDGELAATRTGELAPGESRTVTFSRSFASTGEHTVEAAGRSLSVRVRDPAAPTVAAVEAPASVAADEPFDVTATVRGAADRPASGSVAVTVDGRTVATREVRLAPGETTTVRATVTLAGTGDHTVAVGNATATVAVGAARDGQQARSTPAATGTARAGGTTTGSGPGFGAAALLAALVALLAARTRR